MNPGRLQFVLVTPEKTLIDEAVTSIQFPLFDGQIGILPSRAPMVGRLGSGELRFSLAESGETQSYFIDSGFAQVKGSVVSVLTNRAILPEEIDAVDAQSKLDEVKSRVAITDEEALAKFREQESARKMLHMSKK